MQLFYTLDLESDLCTLNEEESKHCIRVLRMSNGSTIHVTNGKGTLCQCTIIDDNPKHCTARIVERHDNFEQHNFYLHIALAPTKNNARIEWFLEKAVEMGIDEITPIVCDHSERCILKRERLEKIAISAMKQSLKAYLPVINDPTPVCKVIGNAFSGQRFIAYCDGDIRTPLHDAYRAGNNALILIGPEGDFSNNEIQQALQSGFAPVTLGNYRLRTETAALAATAFFNLVN